ncbi:hypothetical protein [Legionella micdadei]|uniref:Uncharacterized protein n=1 Tax=Legionella micdadei TaxID=451 RepID=A0A098GIM9_LEGMI|nr:hypothetical protein [Legionella micdadei]ARG96763.1 hypothetical protein B6N58_03270 [Legionella micdadei]KTD26432.1 hypothetical protein Lmic_2526 [Legionella micdadei]NSL17976.1 hypothetical protein [Legionella micdadei]CEG61852.1 exported protein of unknown function [Legionella micdadei]SCY25505.1 hypothetical protein SAMN02982997_01226 [Legionella micdadei]
MKTYLILLFASFFSAALFANNAKTIFGIEYPTFQMFINDKENSRFKAECTEIRNNTGDIECTFHQVSIMHNDAEKEREKIALFNSQSEQELQSEISSMKQWCKDMNNGSKADTEEKQRLIKSFKKFCDNPSKEGMASLLKESLQETEQTCKIYDKTWSEKFKFNAVTNQWISQLGPTGDCGFIDISHLEKDPRKGFNAFSWNYVSKRIITNKNGNILTAKCSQLIDDEKDFVSYGVGSLKYETNRLMNCKYINLSEFI